jgi:tetratricopeptide (TPR) repeat protein
MRRAHQLRGPAFGVSAAACLGLLLLQANEATADPAKLLEQGKALLMQGYLDSAIEQLSAAREASTDSSQLAQIALYLGVSYEANGELRQAEDAFAQALKHDPTLRVDDERFKPAVVKLFHSVRQRIHGELWISAGDPGTRVSVNGEAVPRLPHRQRVTVGQYRVEARRPSGEVIMAKQVVVRQGMQTAVKLPISAPRPPPPRPQPRRRSGWFYGKWVALALSVGAAGAAVGLGVAANSARDEGQDLLRNGLREGELARFDDLAGSVDTYRLTSNVLWGVAAGLAVASAVLFYLDARAARSASREGASGPVKPGALGLGQLSIQGVGVHF